jgi:serine/threonine protein phosphatase PrpC
MAMNTRLALECPHCGAEIFADDEFCERCGASLAERRRQWDHVEVERGAAAGVSDRGLVHSRNEDALFVEASAQGAVAVVCDGVSTANSPDRAAQVAAAAAGELLATALLRPRSAPSSPRAVGRPNQCLREALDAANHAVRAVPWLPIRGGGAPACTIVGALWDGVSVSVGWAGDSRAYWIGADAAMCLTSDHSWAHEQVEAGRLTADEAEADGRAHAITRWLGDDAPDGGGDTRTFEPPGPGRIVLCSDGLWNIVPAADELAELVASTTGASQQPRPLDLARTLTAVALRRGARDNVTVAVIDVVPPATGAPHDA